MPNPHWENLKAIFEGAIALAPAERAAYLDRVCDGEDSLRQAVDSLIKSHEESVKFVDKPAFQAAAEMLLDRIDFTPGQELAHYKILSKIGEGGMGQVYLAQDVKLKRRVALKILSSVANGDARKRLLREARAVAALDHPNICGIHEVGDLEGTGYIAMQYIDGETLDLRLKRGPLSCDEALTIASQIAEGLTEAHSVRIVHRDIKPANIILNTRGQVKILDFGLAKLARESPPVHSEVETEHLLSTPGTVVGTVPYMSPEQVRGESLDARSDIFSFGVVLFEMLTGHKLFAAANAVATISAILTKEPEPLEKYVAACPKDLDPVLQKCLVKDRARRYQSMREVATDLQIVQRAASGTGAAFQIGERPTEIMRIAPTAENPKPPLGSKRAWVLAAGAVLVGVISLYAVFSRGPGSTAPSNGKVIETQAHNLYLRGKVNVGSENQDSNETAIKLLEQAVAADSDFAPAYAELARAYAIKAFYFAPEAEKKQLNEDAEVAVEKSLSLNPDLAEGHFARGLILWTHAKRFPHEQAIQSYKRAIALNPNLDEAHHQLALVYFHIGLLDKGWEEIEKALAANPGNTLARFRFGVIHMYRGRYEEALAFFNSTPLDKNPALLSFQKATALFQLGRIQEASVVVE